MNARNTVAIWFLVIFSAIGVTMCVIDRCLWPGLVVAGTIFHAAAVDPDNEKD